MHSRGCLQLIGFLYMRKSLPTAHGAYAATCNRASAMCRHRVAALCLQYVPPTTARWRCQGRAYCSRVKQQLTRLYHLQLCDSVLETPEVVLVVYTAFRLLMQCTHSYLISNSYLKIIINRDCIIEILLYMCESTTMCVNRTGIIFKRVCAEFIL